MKCRFVVSLLGLGVLAGCAVESAPAVDAPEPLTGEGFRVLSTTRTDRSHAVTISAGASGVYIANAASGTITRIAHEASVPGSLAPPRRVVAGENAPTAIVADDAAVYFLDQRTEGQLVSISLDGAQKRVLSNADSVDVAPLAADGDNVFWVPSHSSDLLAISKTSQGPGEAKKLGVFAEDDTGACAVRDIVASGGKVYGVAVCSKDRVASAQLVSIDVATGARKVIDAVSGAMTSLAIDDDWLYYGVTELSAKTGELRRASRSTGGHVTFVASVAANATGPATAASLDEVYYGVGSQVFAAPKDGSTPRVAATIGSLTQDAAIVVQQLAVSSDGVFARVGELDGIETMKSHVVTLD